MHQRILLVTIFTAAISTGSPDVAWSQAPKDSKPVEPPITDQTPVARPLPPAAASCPQCEDRAKRVNEQREEIARARQRRDAADDARELAKASYNRLRREIPDAAAGSAERARLEADMKYWERETIRQGHAVDEAAESLRDHVSAEAKLMRELEECNARCSFQPPSKTRTVLANPKVYGPVIGGVIGTVLLIGGGGGAPSNDVEHRTVPITVTSAEPILFPTTPTPTIPTPAPTTPAPTPAPTLPPTLIDFIVSMSATAWDHAINVAGQSDSCGLFVTTPAQAGVPFTVTTTGPGVVQPIVTGTTLSSGQGRFRVRINTPGPVTFNVSVTSGGVTKIVTGNVNVTGASNSCP